MAVTGPGRPAIGPVVKVALPAQLIEAIAAAAAAQELPRAAWIRSTLQDAVDAS